MTSAPTTDTMATTAGVVTAVAGTILLVAPSTGRLIGLGSVRDSRLVGTLDLALAPGLLLGRPRWPWLAARAVSNVATAAFVMARADGDDRRRARAMGALMAAATIADVHALRTTLAAGRP